MNRLKAMYGSTPPTFSKRVQEALLTCPETCDTRSAVPRLRPRLLIAALIVLLLTGVAAAALIPQTAQWFGWLYGEGLQAELTAGSTAISGQSAQLGDIAFTIEALTATDRGFYLVATIRPTADSVRLIPEDYAPTDPAGHLLCYGPNSAAPEGTPTYAELAEATGARLLRPSMAVDAVGVDGGSMVTVSTYGYSQLPEADGGITVLLELPMGTAVVYGDRYDLRLWLSCRALTATGEQLLPEDNAGADGIPWTITVELSEKGATP